jgi:ElaB/YqjD/DUF883 family membrane-anchored ribosome-binding protein
MGAFTGNLVRLTEEIIAGRAFRQEMRHALKSDIATLRTDVEAMLTDFGKKRVEARQRMQSEMAEFTSRLRHFTRELSEQVIEMRKGFQRSRPDMLGLVNGEIGRFITGLKNEAVEMQSHFTPGAMYESAGDDQDDLTQIPGIGIRRQTLLNQAGIHTFAQLAQSAPDRILQILGKQTGKANVDDLILRAADMCR